jgi:hypothetical protein
MKSAATVLYVMGGSFLFFDIVYLIWSLQAHNFELIGLITLGLSATLCILMAFYLDVIVRSLGETVLAEDRLDAEIDDGDSEVGHFSPWSWWPILVAGSIGIAFLGIAISAWIAIIAVPFLAVSTVGWVFEYYRGYFAH